MKSLAWVAVGVGAYWLYTRADTLSSLVAGVMPVNRKTTGLAGTVGDARQIAEDAAAIAKAGTSFIDSLKQGFSIFKGADDPKIRSTANDSSFDDGAFQLKLSSF